MRMKPKDMKRYAELDTKGKLTAEEKKEHERLYEIFTADRKSRDQGGVAYRDVDGKIYSPSTERRSRRIIKAIAWRLSKETKRKEEAEKSLRPPGKYVFFKHDSLWIITYEGKPIPHIPDCQNLGLSYIHFLIKNTPAQYSPAELYYKFCKKRNNLKETGEQTSFRLMTGEKLYGITEFVALPNMQQQHVYIILGKIKKARAKNDKGELVKCLRISRKLKLKKLSQYIEFLLYPKEIERNKISKAIFRAFRLLSKHDQGLAVHLRQYLRSRKLLWNYSPPQKISWRTQ